MPSDGANRPDFSDDAVFNQWFQENAWGSPPQEWPPERRERVLDELYRVRREIDRRTSAITNHKTDAALVGLGIVAGVAGVAIALPVVAIAVPVAWGIGIGFTGVSVSIAGAARAEINRDAADLLLQRSRDLTQLQRSIIAAR